MCIVKLLLKFHAFSNELSIFAFNIKFTAINLVFNIYTQMFKFLSPGKRISTEKETNAIVLVLHVVGSGSVENLSLCDEANSSHVANMS